MTALPKVNYGLFLGIGLPPTATAAAGWRDQRKVEPRAMHDHFDAHRLVVASPFLNLLGNPTFAGFAQFSLVVTDLYFDHRF